MGAIEMGLAEEELQDLVSAWRRANPAIVKLWKDVQGAAMAALGDDPQKFKGIKFVKRQGILCIELPSNRNLSYYNARVEQGVNGWPQIVYEGVDQTTKKWGKLSTYGGKLVENIVQAIARDCLADAMRRVAEKRYEIVMHVHDEIVVETDEDCLDVLCKIMGEEISWAPGLPLRADGFQTKYYRKD
jgi:DNA polymerase